MRQNEIWRIKIEEDTKEYLKKNEIKQLPSFDHDKNDRRVRAEDGLRSTGHPS